MTKGKGDVYEFDDAKSTDIQQRCEVINESKTKRIKVYEWETDKFVYVELDGEPILQGDIEDEHFEVNIVLEPLPSTEGIATVDFRPSYVVYDEENLRWETQ